MKIINLNSILQDPCPGFGCLLGCSVGKFCDDYYACKESQQDTLQNYCSECGFLNEECNCKELEC